MHERGNKGVIIEAEKAAQEECGVVAVYSLAEVPGPGQFDITATVALGVAHRGQNGTGMMVYRDDGSTFTHRAEGKPAIVLADPELDRGQLNEPSRFSLFHCRYGTQGGFTDGNIQPISQRANDGSTVTVIHNGQLPRYNAIPDTHLDTIPEDASDTHIFTKLLAEAPEEDWDERVTNAFDGVHGAYSMIIAVNDRLYVCRDKLGIRPLVIGQSGDNIVVTSETSGLDQIGTSAAEVRPGSILRIDRAGVSTVQEGLPEALASCGLEWAYFAHHKSLARAPGSQTMEISPDTDQTNFEFRRACGHILAQEMNLPDDEDAFVVSIPNSGRAVGQGFAEGTGLSYEEDLIERIEGNDLRTFMDDANIHEIGARVNEKLIIKNDDRWLDRTVYLLDDSVIRGNVSKNVVAAIMAQGARAVHLVSGYPPFADQCHLGVSTRTSEELIARRHMRDGRLDKESMAAELGVASVSFISTHGFLTARGMQDVDPFSDPSTMALHHDGCLGCVTGQHPIDLHGKLHPIMEERIVAAEQHVNQ